MNTLSIQQKALILSLLTEGNSLRTISRVSGIARNTISKLLLDSGEKAKEMLDREMVNLKCQNLQVDEIWTFVGKKQKRLQMNDDPELGDQYVFVALDASTKLVPAFMVGKRSMYMATLFMKELQSRISTRFQLTTDSFPGYHDAVDSVFGLEVDYAQVHKRYGEDVAQEKRYSPAKIIGITKKPLIGSPVRKRISTSYVERQNLTMRMQMRRFTRLTNGFSKSLKYLEAALALHFWHYNFLRIHETLRVTPAMEAGLTNRLWTWNDLLEPSVEKRAA